MREKWIDNAKGISIILIILGHVGFGVKDIFSFEFVYGIHLVMFFLISGYTTKKKTPDLNYVNARFRRLLLPYFITCFAVMVSDILNSIFIYHDGSINTITAMIKNDLLRSFFASGSITTFADINIGTRIGAIWFLPAMFFASIIFQLMLKYINSSLWLGITSIILSLLSIISAKFIWFPFSIQSAMMAVFFIWIGYEIRERELLKKIRWFHYLIAQIILLLGIWGGYCSIGFVSASIKDIFISVPVGLAGCMLIYLLSVINKHGIIFEYLGKNSLIILCTHLFMLETRTQCMYSFLDTLGFTGYTWGWMLILIEIIFAVLLAAAVNIIKRSASLIRPLLHVPEPNTAGHSTSIFIAFGISILLALITLYPINDQLKQVISTMIGPMFLLFSGYLHANCCSLKCRIRYMLVFNLLPYILFVLIRILKQLPGLSSSLLGAELFKSTLGLSAGGALFPSAGIIGHEYFLLLLFLSALLFLIVEKITTNPLLRSFMIIVISLTGYCLGNAGIFLPWNLDIACWALIIYYLGVLTKKYDLLTKISNYPFLYFLLAPIWIFTVYSSAFQLSTRVWGSYGLNVMGTVSAVILVYMFSSFIAGHLPIISIMLKYIGISSCFIFILGFSFYDEVSSVISQFLNPEYVFHMLFFILTITMISVLLTIPLILISKRKTIRDKYSKITL